MTSQPTSKSTRSRKRGPSSETRDRVVRAVGELLRHDGLGAVTAHRIHERTGVARTTIYRHWPERDDLIRLLVERATFPHHRDRLTGELRHDLIESVGLLIFRFRRRPLRSVLIARMQCGRRSPEMQAMCDAYVAGLLRPIHEVIERGVASGELRPRVRELATGLDSEGEEPVSEDENPSSSNNGNPPSSIDDMVASLTGPLMVQHVLLRQEISDAQVTASIEAFLAHYGVGET